MTVEIKTILNVTQDHGIKRGVFLEFNAGGRYTVRKYE
jgi:hypothetical protein